VLTLSLKQFEACSPNRRKQRAVCERAMKCFAGGPQDFADARCALKTAREPVNLDLLRRLTRRFGRAAADVLEQLLGS